MTLTEAQIKEMAEAAKPLVQWMCDNLHPHCEAKVSANTVEITECLARHIYTPDELGIT